MSAKIKPGINGHGHAHQRNGPAPANRISAAAFEFFSSYFKR
jgi:hypothetical protein